MAVGTGDVDEKAARTLNTAGWRQCSMFRPPADYPLEPRIAFDPNTEWLIVCSQSCTVCSRRFHTDPFVEVAVATLGPKFHERSPEAKGSNIRKLMLPLSGVPGMGVIVCDANRRTFMDRRDFLLWRPEPSMEVSEKSRRLFGGWLARSYVRVAMPDALVVRLTRKPDGLFARVRIALDLGGEAPLHSGIPSIFMRWSPDAELEDGKLYEFRLLFACDDDDVVEQVTMALDEPLKPFRDPAGRDGVVLKSLDFDRADNITLVKSNNYYRLSDWDELSDLGEVAEDHLSAMLPSKPE